MDTHLAFKILVPGTYNIHNSDLMGEWVANDIHLQTTALQLWPQRWPQKAFDQLGRVAGHWVFRLSHFRWLRVWCERLLSYRRACAKASESLREAPTQNASKNHATLRPNTTTKAFRCTEFFCLDFSDLPCQWSWAIKLKLGNILKFSPTLRGCFKIDDHGCHGDPLFTHFQANTPAWELASLPPLVSVGQNSKGKGNPRRIVRQEKSNVAAERKGNFQKSSQLWFSERKDSIVPNVSNMLRCGCLASALLESHHRVRRASYVGIHPMWQIGWHERNRISALRCCWFCSNHVQINCDYKIAVVLWDVFY